MTLDSAAFKGGDTLFGIFYPTGYVLSVFEDSADAEGAGAGLRNAGFADDDLVLASGADVLAYSHVLRGNPSLFTRFERFVSRVYGDETHLADEVVELAKRGHTFVAVYAPDAAATARVANTVRPFAPIVLRKFDALTVTDLA